MAETAPTTTTTTTTATPGDPETTEEIVEYEERPGPMSKAAMVLVVVGVVLAIAAIVVGSLALAGYLGSRNGNATNGNTNTPFLLAQNLAPLSILPGDSSTQVGLPELPLRKLIAGESNPLTYDSARWSASLNAPGIYNVSLYTKTTVQTALSNPASVATQLLIDGSANYPTDQRQFSTNTSNTGSVAMNIRVTDSPKVVTLNFNNSTGTPVTLTTVQMTIAKTA